jgi:carboxymethylenebutenolidase
VIEYEIDLPTPDGTMNTFVTRPDEGGPFPVVFFLMDAPGKREELHDMARRLASTGYVVLLPNLYYRTVREFDVFTYDGPDPRARMFELMSTLTDAMVVADAAVLFAHADSLTDADTSRVGCVGYCMSGPFSLALAGSYPDRIRAAASVYGVRLFGEGGVADLAVQASGELYIACAETDHYAPTEMINGLTRHLAAHPVRARVEVYPGTEHGFAFPGRGALFHKASAETHWSRLHALFARM